MRAAQRFSCSSFIRTAVKEVRNGITIAVYKPRFHRAAGELSQAALFWTEVGAIKNAVAVRIRAGVGRATPVDSKTEDFRAGVIVSYQTVSINVRRVQAAVGLAVTIFLGANID
jgi:hypothetical protein